MWKMLPFTEIVKMGVLKTRGMVGGECVEGVGNTGSRQTFYEDPLRHPSGGVM